MTSNASQTPEDFLYKKTRVHWVLSARTENWETHSLLRQQATDLELLLLANKVSPERTTTNEFTEGIPRERLSLTQAAVTQLQENGFRIGVDDVVHEGKVVDRRRTMVNRWIQAARDISH